MNQRIKAALSSLTHFNPSVLIVAAIISALSVLGTKYSHLTTLVGQSTGVYRGMMLWFALWFIVFYVIASLLFNYWDDSQTLDRNIRGGSQWKTSPKQFETLCFFAMLLSWTLWITLHYPGAMRDDTLTQIFQSLGYLQYYTQHPIFDTLLFGAFFKLGIALGSQWFGLFLFLIVQAAVTSATFSYILFYFRKSQLPKAFVVAAMLFFMFARVIYAPLNTMSKDAVNGWSFVLACLFMVEIIRTQSSWLHSVRNMIIFILVVFFCIASKRTMMYLIVPCMAIIAISLIRTNKHTALRIIAAAIAPALLVTLVLTHLIDATLHPIHSVTYEMYSVPVQQVVRTVKDHPEALTLTEKQDLSSCFNIDQAVSTYNPNRSDEVNNCWKPNADKGIFWKTWIKLATEYPLSYFEAFECLSGKWMSLNENIIYNSDLHVLNSDTQMDVWDTMQYAVDKKTVYSSVFPIPDPPSNILTTIANKLDHAQERIPLVSSYGLYCFALPFLVFIYAISKRNEPLLIGTLIWAVLFASFIVGPIALYWYTVPAAFSAPLVLALPLILKSNR